MMMRNILSLMLLLIVLTVSSQRKRQDTDTSTYILQPNRVEFPMSDTYMGFQVVNGAESGLMVLSDADRYNDAGVEWTIYSMDTTLQTLWTEVYTVPFDSYLIGTEYHDGNYYFLINTSKYRSQDLLLLEINGTTADYRSMEISTVFPVELKYFEILGNSAILSGYTNYRPVLLTFDMDEQKPRVVPGFYENKSDILDLILDDQAGMFTVIQQDENFNRITTVRAKTFTAQGDLIQENSVAPGERKSLIDGAGTMFSGGYQYISGTYSRKPSDYSKGLYLAKFINGRQQFVKYHNYADLTNFFGYMNKRRKQRVLDRIQRKASKGKKARFSYRLAVHDVIQRGDEYLMIAEAYYPKYSSSTTMAGYRGAGGFSSPYFQGYQYTHAIVVAFDRNGNVLWDNSFKLDDVVTFSLRKFISINTFGDKLVLMYMIDNIIKTKIIQGAEVIEGETFNPVRLAYASDLLRTRDPEVEGFEKWYGNTHYGFGKQRISNNEGKTSKTSRRVFYINKITCTFPD